MPAPAPGSAATATTPDAARTVDPTVANHAHAPLPVICIDPGHPSEVNPGATLQNGLREVEMVYDVALRLKEKLETVGVARVVMTRNFRSAHGGVITNRQRAEIANAADAALMVRLHCDTGAGSGFTLYYPDRSGHSDGMTGPSVHVIERSGLAARAMHDGMRKVLVEHAGHLKDNGIKGDRATYIGSRQGALTGSIFSQVPVVTVEMVYLSHAEDARFIGSTTGQDVMAVALAVGVTQALEALTR